MNRWLAVAGVIAIAASVYLGPSSFTGSDEDKARQAELRVLEVLNEDQQQSAVEEQDLNSDKDFVDISSADSREPASVASTRDLFTQTGDLNPEAFQTKDHYEEVLAALEKGWIEDKDVVEYRAYLNFIKKQDDAEMMEIYGEYDFESQGEIQGGRYEN